MQTMGHSVCILRAKGKLAKFLSNSFANGSVMEIFDTSSMRTINSNSYPNTSLVTLNEVSLLYHDAGSM